MRGVGRTRNLIDNLPDERCVVVTYSHDLGREIKKTIEDLRGKELIKKVKVVSVSSKEDLSRLQGLSVPIFFDHSFFDSCEFETAKHAMELAHGASTVYHHQKGKLK